jgi:hypothetical protein
MTWSDLFPLAFVALASGALNVILAKRISPWLGSEWAIRWWGWLLIAAAITIIVLGAAEKIFTAIH